jgi:hypothetical protein
VKLGYLLATLALGACTTTSTTSGDANGGKPPGGQATGGYVDGLPTEYPGTLVDIGKVPRDFLMRQKLQGAWQDQKFSFEAVIQAQGGKLTVIALTPFGTKAFLLEQTGMDVSFEKFVDREMPFPPEYILQDIHRAFLYDAELPWGVAGADGANEADVHDEHVVDQYEGGRLVSRTFARVDGYPAGEITVAYDDDGMVEGKPPKHILFRNGWFGYELKIKTVDYRPL